MANSDESPEERLPLEGAAQDSGHEIGTPIYDALYAEYRGGFRTVPGDRWGEEELKFRPFDHLQLPKAGAADDEEEPPVPRAA